MSSFTKKAIEASFLKLLNEAPLSHITVKMIVDDCHINCNSFYYHFQDIVTNVRCFTYETPETGSDLKGIFCLSVPSGQFSVQTVIPLLA